MQKLKNNTNKIITYLKFFIVATSFIFILYYVFERISGISINNIFIYIIYYILILIMLLTVLRFGMKLIFKHINPFGEIIYHQPSPEVRKEYTSDLLIIFLLALIVNGKIPYSKIAHDYLRLLLISCNSTFVLFIYVEVVKKNLLNK